MKHTKLLTYLTLLLLFFTSGAISSCKNEETSANYPTPPPSEFTATEADAQITLNWKAPESQFVSEYSLTWEPGDGNVSLSAETRTYTANQLTNGTEYTFTLKAIYENGVQSDPVTQKATPIAADVPAPENFTAQSGDKEVSLSWSPATSENIKAYLITWTPGDGNVLLSAETTSYTVTSLTNGTSYTFSIAAIDNEDRKSASVSESATPQETALETWPEEGMEDAVYINNGIIQLGVDMDRGGSIFHFSEVDTKRNLLNHADEGRFMQQSYYGESDGSNWNGTPWVWNPIQGGGSHGEKARVISQNITPTSINIVSEPVHWASGEALSECEMEETITLDGRIAHIHYTFRNNGPGATNHPATHQEVPAVFMDNGLSNLVFYSGDKPWTNDELTRYTPPSQTSGTIVNEERTRTEHWAAYVDDKDWGLGVYTPGTPQMTLYRFGHGSGPTSGACSYFAPIRTFAVTKDLIFEYDVYLYIGTVDQIRDTFYDIRSEGWEIDDSGFPAGYFYIKESDQVTVTDDNYTGTNGTFTLETTGTSPSVTTQRIAENISDQVLTFRYKCDKEVGLSVKMDDNAIKTRIMPLSPTSDWSVYSFDLGNLISESGWGSVGSRIQIFLDTDAGTQIDIQRMRMRPRTIEEENAASALFIALTGPENQLEQFEDLTDYFSYATGYTYLYQAEANADDPYIATAPRTRAIANDENKLSFEYKCAKGGSIEFFFKIIAGCSVSGLNFPAADDWTSITFDITAGKASALQADPSCLNSGGQMRFDINGINGTPLYIRNIRIHK